MEILSILLLLLLLNRTAPLGSIPELPAESCSEIKASEGNEMVNGDYWIYSDESGNKIITRCEGMVLSEYISNK